MDRLLIAIVVVRVELVEAVHLGAELDVVAEEAVLEAQLQCLFIIISAEQAAAEGAVLQVMETVDLLGL